MGYTNDFFNGFIKWGVLLPDLRFFGYTGMEKSTGRDVDLYFLGGRIFRSTALTAGQDLNNCYSDVTYYSNGAAVTKSLVNRPEDVTTYGVILFVLRPYGSSGNYATQILINKADIYIRLNQGTATEQDWSTWKKVAFVTQ